MQLDSGRTRLGRKMMSNTRLLAQGTSKIPLILTIAYLLIYFCFWTSVDVTFHQEPPIDNLEQLNWALNPALGYSKHPPFPTWVLWIAEQALPAGLYLTYFLGAAEVAGRTHQCRNRHAQRSSDF